MTQNDPANRPGSPRPEGRRGPGEPTLLLPDLVPDLATERETRTGSIVRASRRSFGQPTLAGAGPLSGFLAPPLRGDTIAASRTTSTTEKLRG